MTCGLPRTGRCGARPEIIGRCRVMRSPRRAGACSQPASRPAIRQSTIFSIGRSRRLLGGLPIPSLAEPLTEAEIAQARARIADVALRTPLAPMRDRRTWLKLECLQPYGSYKIRGATNVLRARIERDG